MSLPKTTALMVLAPLLIVAGIAQTSAQPPLALSEPETIHSEGERDRAMAGETVQAVLDPVYGVDDQYARWKQPVCFNVYGLTVAAKYLVERRMREVAQKVGAPFSLRDPCTPNVIVAFTRDIKASLDSIFKVRNDLLPDYNFIHMRLKQSQPVQAWYGISIRGADGSRQLLYGDAGDGISQGPPMVRVADLNRLNTGIETALETVVIVVDTNSVTGKSLETLADYFAVLALAQTRDTQHCKQVPSIVNLMFQDCDAAYRPDAITGTDLAMLTGLYRTSDASLQVLQRQRIIGNMKHSLEEQRTR